MNYAREFKMPFGKYKGETLEDIYVEDIGYLEWLLDEYKKRSTGYRGNQPDMMKEKIEQCFKEMRNVRIGE